MIFCFLFKMSDDGVGVEADYHEKVRIFFKTHLLLSYRILLIIDEMKRWLTRWLMWTERSRFMFLIRVSHDGGGDCNIFP